MTSGVTRALAFALAFFGVFLALGAAVSHVAPGPFDVACSALYGQAIPLARVFTAIGRFPVYFALCLVSVVFVAFRRAWAIRVAISIAGLVVTWQTSDLFKALFHRARPAHPILAETSFGYPSGHADLSIFYYGLWSYYVWNSTLPRPVRIVVVSGAVVFVLAIGWSRLALGAHLATDVLGGYLYGAGWLAVALAAVTLAGRSRQRTASASARR